MPSSPGSRPVSMQLQAGTVIGGSTLRNGPEVPAPTSRRRLGRSSSHRSNTRPGSAQSSPITATLVTAVPSDDPPPGGDRDGLGAGAPVEFPADVMHDVLDRPFGVAQLARDLSCAVPVGKQREHIQLAPREVPIAPAGRNCRRAARIGPL